MSSAASISALRKLIEERFLLLTSELESLCEMEISGRVKEQSDAARSRLADDLNQAVRRLRQSENLEEMGATLADASAGFCNVAAVFAVANDTVRGVRVRGPGYENAAGRFQSMEFPLARAEAFCGVGQGDDPVITISSPAQLSTQVVEFFGQPPDQRVHLFPIRAEQAARAVLYAAGGVQMGPLELLTQAASLALDLRTRPVQVLAPQPATPLVSIQSAAAPPARPAWEELPLEEQRRHMRAQRFARVQVAEMRLYHANAVKSGRLRSDLYGELRETIDAARAAFRESFVTASRTMVDYLHLELLRTLAHDDDALLGREYPGPLV
jgi:hypothetical protein